jgi:hypothetical protein
MKILPLLLPLLLLFSCAQDEPLDGKEVVFRFGAYGIDGQQISLTAFSSLRVVAVQDEVVRRVFSFSPEMFAGDKLTVTLPIGKYRLLFIANGPEDKAVSCAVGDPLENVLLNLVKEGSTYHEAADFLTAFKSVNITTGGSNTPLSISLERRVAKVRVTLNDLSPDIDSVKIELDHAPKSLSADGLAAGSAVTIAKRAVYVKGSGKATADLLTFPLAAGKAGVSVLYSIGHITYRGFMKLAPAVGANQVVVVTGKYVPAYSQGFLFDVQEWDERNPVNGGSVDLGSHDTPVEDNTPPAGLPVGDNLLMNGSFESWTGSKEATAWSLAKAGTGEEIRRNETAAHVAAGAFSCFVGPKTYIYQDIPVTGRRCYQIRLKVKSNTDAYKWRAFCSWRKTASTALPAAKNEVLHSSDMKTTDGWIEVFGNDNKFRAPIDANILRVEIRTYTADPDLLSPSTGVYLDAFDVRLLKE